MQPLLEPLVQLPSDRYEILRMWRDQEAAVAAADAQALVMAGEFPLTRDVTDRLTALRLVACFSAGYDGVDMAWATRNGILVTHAAHVNEEDVADHAIGLIVTSRRKIIAGDARIRAGEWTGAQRMVTRSLKDARLGIVGLGGIGEAIARRAEPMRMRIAWWGPRTKPSSWPRADSLEQLAAESDILVVTARATAENVGLISAPIIAALGRDGLLLNVARGQLVDEDAMIAALRDGTLGAAALDVFATEPTPATRWADVPNCVLTPHTSGATDAAFREMLEQLVDNLDAFVAGKEPPGRIILQ